ncbi:MAG TPA: ornithine carbamoyltransferase [Anaerolineaceae bacterium]|nr:ornithine carbamoyltransferase [Anaerolineaceae bacterium]HPN50125.1 ornithine carbamoyltransferase [Anaerolineaceae bacterium]
MKKDFIAISDYSPAELQEMLDLAVELKKERMTYGMNVPILQGKSLGMIFQKPSLRTRVSFEMGMQQLGGYAFYLSPQEIGLGQRESIADVSRVLSGYVDCLMARVFDHQHVLDLAKWASIPVINGLSDYNHPCQGMADALTILEEFGKLKGLNVVFLGDGNNVAVSLMHICTKLGANFVLASPEGYDLNPEALALGQKFAAESGAKITLLRDPHEAVKHADVIYTDTWTSMGQEAEAKKREAVFPPYQVNAGLVAEANKHAIVLHCLPAHRNHEITDEVADGAHSRLFPQAHNRMHAQKAILVKMLK